MKYLALTLSALLLAAPAVAEKEPEIADEDCEELVDSMDDLSFADAIDCDEDETPAVLKSLSSYFNGNSKKEVVVLYDQPEQAVGDNQRGGLTSKPAAATAVSAPAAVSGGDGNAHAGTSFVIREQYSLQRGAKLPSLGTAVESLHATMADYCPMGWEKEREWTAPAEGSGFYLHYLFTCQ